MRSATTATQYAYNVRLCQEWFSPKSLDEATTSDLVEYLQSLPPSGSLRNLRRSAVSAYFEFRNISPNPAKELPYFKHTSRLPVPLGTEQARALIDEGFKHSAFYGTLLAVLLLTGIRISEALSLQWVEVFIDHAYAIQKGGAQRIVWFVPELADYMKDWRAGAPLSRYVFPSETLLRRGIDRPLPRQTANLRIRELGEAIGVIGFHPHLARHTVGVDVARATGSPLAVQAVLGHNNIQSSMVYLRALGQDVPAVLAGLSYTKPPQDPLFP